DSRYLRRGHGPDLIKGLQRGKWPIGASLDLHGSTLEQARERLDRFLQSCLAHQIKCARIVHGKGYGSKDGEPVLKQTIRRWLSQIASVIAYVECSEQDGGAGAVYVLLRADTATF
ncbi:MAG TPA: Smr/MutS family protein, partial [Pusillimonas sp.]